MKITQLNHVALHVSDVERSVAFYRDVLGLTPIPRPAFDFPGAWFGIGQHQELHLIGGGSGRADSASRGNHFAMAVDSAEDAALHLRALGVQHRGPSRRPDGALQVFLNDPDGHVIELCSTG